jgi:D-alanyl-D-alanine carboxypeptidase
MSDAAAAAELAPRLDQVLARAASETNVPGVQAALVRKGGVAWSGTYGLADRDAATPVTDETVFCLASLGKTLVASLALRLVEQARLDLDEPIASVLAEVPGSSVVTPRMLLTHTSGYPDLYDTPDVASLMPPDPDEPGSGTSYDPDRPFTWEMLRPGILEPVDPGARWEYSNAGYVVLLEVISRVVGGPDAIAAEWTALSDPTAADLDLTDDLLTMHRSRVRLDRLAHGYDERPDGALVDAYAAHPATGVPTDLFGLPFGDGLFAGTAVGVATYLDALFGRRVVLDPATIDQMTTVTAQATKTDHPDMDTYGMGTFRMQAGGGVWQGHRGRYGGFSTVGMTGTAGTLVVLTNSMSEDPPVVPVWRALAEETLGAGVTGGDAAGSAGTR